MSRKRVLTGYRPTGRLTLGHWFGNLMNMRDLQDEYDAYYFVADWHALTSDWQDTSAVRQYTEDMVLDWVAAGTQMGWLFDGALLFVYLNLALLFFNLIPLPPLDGSRVLPLFLSDNAMRAYGQWERYGFLILFGVMWLAPRFLGFDPIDAYFSVTVRPLVTLLTGVSIG